jgi:hypothetical protein
MAPARPRPRGAWRVLGGVVAALLIGCSKPDAIHFRVTNTGTAEVDRILDLRVYAGADKSSWPYVEPRETLSVRLDPGGDPPNMTLSFKLRDQEGHWRAPALEQGIGYAVAVEIRPDGSVAAQHCRRPCTLP